VSRYVEFIVSGISRGIETNKKYYNTWSSSMRAIALISLVLCLVLGYTLAHAPEDIVPGIIELDDSNYEKYLDGSKPTIVEFYAPWCGHCKNLAPEMTKLGEAFVKARTETVQYAKVNCEAHRAACAKYDVKGYPTIKFFPYGSTTPEDYNSGRSAEDLANFMNEKAGSKIRIPKEPSFVVDLTPSNYDQIVMDSNKDVLVEFYAPWCGHCKKLVPEYEKAAQAFQNDQNIVIAKMDADKFKDIPSRYDVKGFPTLKFFPRGSSSKTAEEYGGDRTAEGIVGFMNKKAGTSRSVSGLLSDDAGLVGSLTSVAKRFLAAAQDARAGLISEGEKAIENLAESSKKHADHYIKYMKKIAEKGEDYIETEYNRLTKILGGSNVASDRADDMKVRQNILRQFRK
jgi:protein disulfide-isomerase A6